MTNRLPRPGWILVFILCFIPVILWSIQKPLPRRFSTPTTTLTSLGQITGLVGLVLFSLSLTFSARLRVFEPLFGGLNRVYIAHHLIGGTSLLFLLTHPLFLSGSYLTLSLRRAVFFLLPGPDWTINLGIMSLALLITLMILTFYVNLPYEIWLFSHKFLGAVFFIGGLHSLLIPSDIALFPPLKYYILIISIFSLLLHFYRTLFGRFLVRRLNYQVSRVFLPGQEVTQVDLIPIGKSLTFLPGQFVFVSIADPLISGEVHPFSLCSSPSEPVLSIAAKNLGDYTARLFFLASGVKAKIEGPFGQFSYLTHKNQKQIWVAGGIGVTPFVSMAKSLTSPDYQIDLFYAVKDQSELVYSDIFQKVAADHPNFRYHPHASATAGRLTADVIKKILGDVTTKDIYICGPPPMMKGLRDQFHKAGLPHWRVYTEEFNIN